MKRYGLGLGIFAVVGALSAFAGCSVETKASDVICVPDQSNICSNCEKPAGDTRFYAGRHVCAHDGKSFGKCEQCAPQVEKSDFNEIPVDRDKDAGTIPVTPAKDTIDAACAGKIAVIAGKDDDTSQFTYSAVYEGTKFRPYSSSGTPMRSPAAAAPNGPSVLVVYRSKNNSLISTSFANSLWGSASSVAGASLEGAPALTTWDGKIKAVFREDDGYHHVANYDPATGWQDGIEVVGSTTVAPPPGISDPSVVSTGTPGLSGAGVMVGYTDNANGLYRQEWHGTSWFPKGIKASTVQAGPYRPTIVAMASGDFDLLSIFINAAGDLRMSTRTSKDNGSLWSADMATSDKAQPASEVNGVGLDGGRALVVYLDKDKIGQYLLFDPKKTPAWTDPAPLLSADENVVLSATPQLTRDPCGAEAILALPTDKGVAVLRFAGDKWKGPYVVDGIPGITYATVVAAP
jgi:hypothetical protein